MADMEKVIDGLERLRFFNQRAGRELWQDKPYDIQQMDIANADAVYADALELLKEQENLIKEYEKLSQVCFKIEKYLRIADLSILIDRIEEGKVEVLQDDGRPDSMETTIKIRRL